MTRDSLSRTLFTLLIVSLFAALPAMAQQTWIVDYHLDLPDLNPGDGLCETAHNACTLRAAIEEANATANVGAAADTIRFGHFIQTNGYQAVTLTAGSLPTIVEKVFIDAMAAGVPILVDGGGQHTGLSLAIGSGGSTVRGLFLANFWHTGISIASNGNKIQSTAIGFLPDGTSADGGEYGIYIDGGDNNTIGGAGRGNFVGHTNGMGIFVSDGIGNKIQGNYIGTDDLGTDRGGQNTGVGIYDGSEDTLIGGATAALGNTIGFSASTQLYIFQSTGTIIQNNFIGTNDSGADLGSVGNGIIVRDTLTNPTNTMIGGSADLGNTIGFNSSGISLSSVENVTIQGNFVGVTREGDVVGNTHHGIVVMAPSNTITIGYGATTVIPTGTPLGNTIAGNGENGILVGETTNMSHAGEVSIRGNRIRNNGEKGISLLAGGGLTNDAGDLDAGSNRRQNHPVFTSASIIAATGKLRIKYSVPTSALAATYPLKVDFYEADNATSGEGKRYLGSHTYSTPLSTVTINVDTTGIGLKNGDHLVATATDLVGNTSEFSTPIAISFPATPSVQGFDAVLENQALTAEVGATDRLGAPYPNPFNPQTTFSLSLAEASPAHIAVYDALGRQVALLHDGELSASTHQFTFDGAGLATGVYLLRVQTSRFTESRRLMLVK